MFKLAAAVLVLAVVGIQGRPQSDAVAYDCTDKPDGVYSDASNPQAFFVCKDGAVTERAFCVDGFKFDGVESCVPDEEKESVQVEEKESQTVPQVYTDNNDDEYFDDDFEGERGKKLIYNIEVTKNIFPKSVLIIGKMNREQKNK